jgi:hypothetical protein
VFDRGNRLLRNRLSGGGNIRIQAGNIDCDAVQRGGRPQACETYLEGNSGLLIVGYQSRSDRFRAEDTVVRSHSGQIQLRYQRRTSLPGASSATGQGPAGADTLAVPAEEGPPA